MPTHYKSPVPTTLDLADRARMSVHSLTSSADPSTNYETYQCLHFDTNPPFFTHNNGGPCLPKVIHTIPLMRKMSGSLENADYDSKMLTAITDDIDKNGLWWLRTDGKPYRLKMFGEDTYWPMPHARLMMALMAIDDYNRNKSSMVTLNRLANGLKTVALENKNHAWYENTSPGHFPLAQMPEHTDALSKMRLIGLSSGIPMGSEIKPFSTEGDTSTNPPTSTVSEPSSVNFQTIGNALRSLSQWYRLTGDDRTLELAEKTAKFMMKSTMWGPSEGPTQISGIEHAHWQGHFHTRTTGVMGLLDYATITNDHTAKRFVKDFYEYTKKFGIGRIGFFPSIARPLKQLTTANRKVYGGPGCVCETCSIGDMIYIASQLSKDGIGNYWEDVDQYVRNHLVETQILRRDYIEEIVSSAIPHDINETMESTSRVIDRGMGGFVSCSDPTLLHPWWTSCCNTNGPVGLYEAWDSIVQYNNGTAQINLLLNRASPWVDICSYLPYEGKVEFINKVARQMSIRIPSWTDKRAVVCKINGAVTTFSWLSDYILIDSLTGTDKVTLTFPMSQTTEAYTLPDYNTTYKCSFKGNTLVDISPRPDKLNWSKIHSDDGEATTTGKGYPIYIRDHLKGNIAPIHEVMNYVHDPLLNS